MADEKESGSSPAEDSIKVICRFRPLNTSEEKAGSKFIVKFPSQGGADDNACSIGVSSIALLLLTVLEFPFQVLVPGNKTKLEYNF